MVSFSKWWSFWPRLKDFCFVLITAFCTSKKNSAFAEFFFYILIVGLEPYEGKKR